MVKLVNVNGGREAGTGAVPPDPVMPPVPEGWTIMVETRAVPEVDIVRILCPPLAWPGELDRDVEFDAEVVAEDTVSEVTDGGAALVTVVSTVEPLTKMVNTPVELKAGTGGVTVVKDAVAVAVPVPLKEVTPELVPFVGVTLGVVRLGINVVVKVSLRLSVNTVPEDPTVPVNVEV